jgi:hypothetical protein
MKTQDKIGAAINKITGRKPQQTPRGTQTSDIATTRTAEKKAKQTGKPMTGASINDPRVRRAVEKAANRATGSEGEVPIHGTAQKTQQLRHGKHTDNSGNPNKGLTRTGSTRPSD